MNEEHALALVVSMVKEDFWHMAQTKRDQCLLRLDDVVAVVDL